VRRFFFQRDEDVSGTSGTGIVVHGIEFNDGTCVVHWLGDRPSTVVWNSIDDAIYIHGHGGGTRLVWVDGVPPTEWELKGMAKGHPPFKPERLFPDPLPGLEESA
jgi:hypothetical protein